MLALKEILRNIKLYWQGEIANVFQANVEPKTDRDGSSNKQPKTLEMQRGRWDDMVYSLPLGVDTNTAIKLELRYLGV